MCAQLHYQSFYNRNSPNNLPQKRSLSKKQQKNHSFCVIKCSFNLWLGAARAFVQTSAFRRTRNDTEAIQTQNPNQYAQDTNIHCYATLTGNTNPSHTLAISKRKVSAGELTFAWQNVRAFGCNLMWLFQLYRT